MSFAEACGAADATRAAACEAVARRMRDENIDLVTEGSVSKVKGNQTG